MQADPAPLSKFRLRFIDMARAVAILLMLEGHFVDVTLAPEWRAAGNPVYDIWLYVRGLAAPMFFTVTGLIFAYLLAAGDTADFFRARRVRRGLVRAVELFFWGYVLQLNLRALPDLGRVFRDPWLQAFHVLQCIAVGLLLMIVVFGLVRRAGVRWLAGSYVFLGFCDFLFSVLLANHGGPLPEHAPAWLQNALKGPWTTFPVAPWLGFTLYGAAIGVLLRWHGAGPHKQASAGVFLLSGLLLKTAGWGFDRLLGRMLLDLTGQSAAQQVIPAAFHGRIGEILLILAALVWLENRFRLYPGWLLTIGRNTFPIYVAHVVVLYGGIFGIGIDGWVASALTPWQAALGALVFCAFFAIGAQGIEPLTQVLRRLRMPLAR